MVIARGKEKKMPVFIEFNENGEEVQKRELLNSNNLTRYIEQDGSERAKGYLDALEDFTRYFSTVLGTERMSSRGEEIWIPSSPILISKEINKFQEENIALIEQLKCRLNC